MIRRWSIVVRPVGDLLPSSSRVSAPRVALYAALIWTGLLVIRPDVFVAESTTLENDHALLSMEIALARAYCGGPSKISPTIRLPYDLRDNPSLGGVGIRRLIEERAGSVEQYCLSVGSPVINNENSLMWIVSWIFYLRPDSSFAGLGQALHLMRIAGLAVFSLALLLSGAGILLTAATVFTALTLLHQMQADVLSSYPFMFVSIPFTAALYTLAVKAGAIDTPQLAAIAGGAAGMWTAFAVNMRTSHLPVYMACALVMLIMGARGARGVAGARAARVAVFVVLFALGYAAFQYVAISRHLLWGEVPGSTEHSIAHAVVLGLGVPENDVSRREGITWSDAIGWTLARRVDPQAPYLGERYEAALFEYYRGLWRANPREMVGVYLTKARTAGKQMLMVLRGSAGTEGRMTRWLLTPLDVSPDGVALLAVYLGAAVAAAVAAWRGNAFGQLMLYLALAAILLHGESIAIVSTYVLNYHAYLAFYSLFVSLTALCLVLSAVWRSTAAARR